MFYWRFCLFTFTQFVKRNKIHFTSYHRHLCINGLHILCFFIIILNNDISSSGKNALGVEKDEVLQWAILLQPVQPYMSPNSRSVLISHGHEFLVYICPENFTTLVAGCVTFDVGKPAVYLKSPVFPHWLQVNVTLRKQKPHACPQCIYLVMLTRNYMYTD